MIDPLLDRAMAPRIAAGLRTVLEAGNRPGGRRPTSPLGYGARPLEPA
jgi:argininosuccinate lyase